MPCLCADAAVRHSTAATRLPADASSPAHDGATRCRVPRKRTRAVQPPRMRDLRRQVPRRAGMARDVGLRLVERRTSTRAAGPRDHHARRGTHRQPHGSVPPIHRRGVCLCFLAAFGMRSGQLTMRSSRSASATSSSYAPTRPRTEIPAWCTVSGSPETSGCHQ
jgi:hypothetical protein